MNSPRFSAPLVGFACGSVFAVGLALSGMTDPQRVLAFLDFFGNWDPSLAFVMAGAIGIHFTWLRFATQGGGQPSVAAAPGRLDARLLLGAAIFGVGWGMAGYCPGPALVAAGSGRGEAWLFGAAMAAGMVLFGALTRRQTQPEPAQEAS